MCFLHVHCRGYGKNLLTTACSRGLVAHSRSEMPVENPARQASITKAKWLKLTVGHFRSVYRRQRKSCLRSKLSAAVMQITPKWNVCMCCSRRLPNYYFFLDGNIFLGKIRIVLKATTNLEARYFIVFMSNLVVVFHILFDDHLFNEI